jgi:hypothetical protein
MSIQETINQHLSTLPENLHAQILNFVLFFEYQPQLGNITPHAFSEEQRRQKLGECLEQLAKHSPFTDIEDPVAWQREIRKDRALPGREA